MLEIKIVWSGWQSGHELLAQHENNVGCLSLHL